MFEIFRPSILPAEYQCVSVVACGFIILTQLPLSHDFCRLRVFRRLAAKIIEARTEDFPAIGGLIVRKELPHTKSKGDLCHDRWRRRLQLDFETP